MSELRKQWIDDDYLWQDFLDYFNPDFDEIADIKQMSCYDILITMKMGCSIFMTITVRHEDDSQIVGMI